MSALRRLARIGHTLTSCKDSHFAVLRDEFPRPNAVRGQSVPWLAFVLVLALFLVEDKGSPGPANKFHLADAVAAGEDLRAASPLRVGDVEEQSPVAPVRVARVDPNEIASGLRECGPEVAGYHVHVAYSPSLSSVTGNFAKARLSQYSA